MKIKIMNWNSRYNKNDDFIAVKRMWFSPDEKYAVAEIFRSELFVSGEVICRYEDECIIEFLDEMQEYDCEVGFKSYSVNWDSMNYGFFKIISSDFESGDTSVHRVYFK